MLDESANTLFLTELWRGLALTLKVFFERPVTVRAQAGARAGARAPSGLARRTGTRLASRSPLLALFPALPCCSPGCP